MATTRTAQEKVVTALVEHLLTGFTATTVARGIAIGSKEAVLVKQLGKPEVVHRDQDMGGGRMISEAWWEREVEIAGMTLQEKLKVVWPTKPVARGVTSAGITLVGDASSARVFNAAFAEVKARLGAIYKKGVNKSTFRAPGLALDDDEGFAATFRYAPATLIINAGVIL